MIGFKKNEKNREISSVYEKKDKKLKTKTEIRTSLER